MHDLVVAVLAAFTGGVVVHAWHRATQADAALPDALDMPAIYQQRNGALYGRPSVAPSAPGTTQAGKEGWGPRG